jgi:acetyl esterase/lipase
MKRVNLLAVAVAALTTIPLAGSSASAGASAGVGASASESISLSSAVAVFGVDYSEGEHPDEVGDPDAPGRWELNLVVPEGCPQPVPVFIDNPGSAWMSTDTNTESHPITDHCYAFAGVNDSASSLCKFPCTTHDIQAAIRWLRAHADGWTDPADGTKYTWSLDPNRFAISGFSSGGWQAAFAGTTNGVKTFSRTLPDGSTYQVDLEGTIGPWEGIYSSDVQAFVPLHPPVDFSRMNPPYTGVGAPSALDHDSANSPESNHVGCTVGTSRDDANPLYPYDPACEAKVQAANPINYISHDDPPAMMFHGSSDSLVPHGQSVDLYTALRDNCNDVRFYSMDGQNHATVYMGLPASAPYVWYQSANCGSEHVAPGPPEETVLLPEGQVTTRYSATWAGVAAFLDDHLRETAPPQLDSDLRGNPTTANALRDRGFVTVNVMTDEASSYVVELLAKGERVGATSVPIYRWGIDAPKGTPAPYAASIKVPIDDPRRLNAVKALTVRVTASDRVANTVRTDLRLALTQGQG